MEFKSNKISNAGLALRDPAPPTITLSHFSEGEKIFQWNASKFGHSPHSSCNTACGEEFWRGKVAFPWSGTGRFRTHIAEFNTTLLRPQCTLWAAAGAPVAGLGVFLTPTNRAARLSARDIVRASS